MKYLFVIDSGDRTGATQLLARRLSTAFADLGNDVDLLDVAPDEERDDEVMRPRGVRVHIVRRRAAEKLDAFMRAENAAGKGRLTKLLDLMKNRELLRSQIDLFVRKIRTDQVDIKYAIEGLCKANRYDVVVSASAPYCTSFALAYAKISAKKAVMMFDPYHLGVYFPRREHYLEEKKMYRRADIVFVSPKMYREYEGSVFKRFIPKLRVFEFPGIERNIFENGAPKKTEGDMINCVYVGNLYLKLRMPDFALQLFAYMNDPKLKLRFVIGGTSLYYPKGYENEYKKVLGDRFEMITNAPYAEAFSEMENADILINLGNSVPDMIPSKVYDCFSIGKPILNLCTIRDDSALSLLEKYPLVHTVFLDEGVEAIAEGCRAFCRENRGKTVPFEEVERIYKENTPKNVARYCIGEIENACQNKKRG